jgi:hypothetical protein
MAKFLKETSPDDAASNFKNGFKNQKDQPPSQPQSIPPVSV